MGCEEVVGVQCLPKRSQPTAINLPELSPHSLNLGENETNKQKTQIPVQVTEAQPASPFTRRRDDRPTARPYSRPRTERPAEPVRAHRTSDSRHVVSHQLPPF